MGQALSQWWTKLPEHVDDKVLAIRAKVYPHCRRLARQHCWMLLLYAEAPPTKVAYSFLFQLAKLLEHPPTLADLWVQVEPLDLDAPHDAAVFVPILSFASRAPLQA